jgi:hypothetical protein
MVLNQNRTMSILAATAAALAIGASPALAGENDDDDESDEDEVTQIAPIQSSGSGSEAGMSQSGVPQGGVAAGAGGMAEQGLDATLLGLASGALVLMATGGGLIAVGRRAES